jgi:hypothetical protein
MSTPRPAGGVFANNSGMIVISGTGNTIDSTSATAVTVANTDIGAAGATFQRISSGNNTAAANPVKGIVLNATGAAGGLTVTGNGGTCTVATPTCTGGDLQNTTGDARSRGQRVEHTYECTGALTYLAALDIGRKGRKAPEGLRPRRAQRRHRHIRPACLAADDQGTLRVRARRGCSGSPTTAPPTAGSARSNASRAADRTRSSSTCPCAPAGSTRSRSSSRSSSARRSPATTMRTSPCWPARRRSSKGTATPSPNRSSGTSPETTSPS